MTVYRNFNNGQWRESSLNTVENINPARNPDATGAVKLATREEGSNALGFYTDLKVVYVDYMGRKREGNLY